MRRKELWRRKREGHTLRIEQRHKNASSSDIPIAICEPLLKTPHDKVSTRDACQCLHTFITGADRDGVDTSYLPD